MSVHAVERDQAPAKVAPPIVHRFIGIARPQPGDKALCGFVKKAPFAGLPFGSATCVVCLSLYEAMRS